MSQRTQLYVLAGLVVLLVVITYFYFFRTSVPGLSGVLAADSKFEPLDVQEPSLRLDQLDRLRKLEYSGSHRNIFVAGAPPLPKPGGEAAADARPFIGPKLPPPPPPFRLRLRCRFIPLKSLMFSSSLAGAQGLSLMARRAMIFVGSGSLEPRDDPV